MKRQIIRSFFTGLLLLCVGGGGLSYKLGWCVGYVDRYHWGVNSDSGTLYLTRLNSDWWLWDGKGWYAFSCPPSNFPEYEFAEEAGGGHYWFGFFINHNYEHDGTWLAIPFWFPATISAALLWWVWRKNRPKLNPKKAFPVELDKPSDDKGGRTK